MREITEEGIGGAEAEAELERRLSLGVQLPDLLETISAALELERAVAEDIVNPRWNVRTAEIIKIIRQERAAVRREALGKWRREIEDAERLRNMQTGGGYRGESET